MIAGLVDYLLVLNKKTLENEFCSPIQFNGVDIALKEYRLEPTRIVSGLPIDVYLSIPTHRVKLDEKEHFQ